jgi:cell division protein ZapA
VKEPREGVTVTILGKEFLIACPEDERQALLESAEYLDRKMREIHATGKVIGTERTAIMAALNIANELLTLRKRGTVPEDLARRLRFLEQKIESALRM